MRERKLQIKEDDKRAYDKANRAVQPNWKKGDRVLLQDLRVKPYSNRVITNGPYHGPMVIQEIVQKSMDIGKAYQLVREDNQKPLRYLVTADRLKKFDTDRTDLLQRIPPMTANVQQHHLVVLVTVMFHAQLWLCTAAGW